MSSESQADAIDFTSLDSQSVSSLDVGGVTISGSSTLSIGSNGLGILGGVLGPPYADAMIDPTESVTFRFDSPPGTDIVLTAQGIGSFGNAPISAEGESLITAFGPTGQRLGTVDLIPSSLPSITFDISKAFSNQPISSFLLQPQADAVSGEFLNLGGLTFAAVPEPSAIAAWSLGLLVVLLGLTRVYRCSVRRPLASGGCPPHRV